MKKKAIFITARSNSSRLPRKHLLKIQGKTCLEYLIEGVKKSKKTNIIVLCSTTNKEDDELCELASKCDICLFRGDEEDKIKRWFNACELFGVDFFVTADGDDIFTSPNLIDLCFEQYERDNADFIRWEKCNIACGVFTYGIKFKALEKVYRNKKTNKTEMMWTFFEEIEGVKIEDLRNIPDIYKKPEYRLTLDYAEDFLVFNDILTYFKRFDYVEDYTFEDIVEYLGKHPWVILYNQFRHKDWRENQERVKNEQQR